MPIIIKDAKWKQTATDVVITAPMPLKNARGSKVDVLISARFVKASFEQYYFEAVLFSPIDESTSKCILTESSVVFELKKRQQEEWASLEPNVSKQEKLELKRRFLEESFKNVQEQAKRRDDRKHVLKRAAVKKQIDLDSETRQNITNIRKMEEQKALGDLEEFKKRMSNKLRSKVTERKAIKAAPTQQAKPPQEVPKTRRSATVEIDFTPRQLPTPCRESKLEEEHEFLAQQAKARRSVGFVSEDIRPEERNPQFVKAKGDEFMRNKNYLGAISAYSYGIRLSKNFVDLYVARSEAQLAQGNCWRAAEDCSRALELLQPICEANLYERATCIGRRGEALCRLGMRKEGLDELRFCLKLLELEHYKEVLEREEVLYEEQLEKQAEEERKKKEAEERKAKLKEEEVKKKKENVMKQNSDVKVVNSTSEEGNKIKIRELDVEKKIEELDDEKSSGINKGGINKCDVMYGEKNDITKLGENSESSEIEINGGSNVDLVNDECTPSSDEKNYEDEKEITDPEENNKEKSACSILCSTESLHEDRNNKILQNN
ncbi:unnamed protein product [Phyllotreta striolata]|uniref:CS domain-containing protein n=1 Tax=Phyllotreta striolata TaxID=444603 RepID=A0A9N9XN89_PHYSR|nr:unnamed protein product [Phyllotreta striolata]